MDHTNKLQLGRELIRIETDVGFALSFHQCHYCYNRIAERVSLVHNSTVESLKTTLQGAHISDSNPIFQNPSGVKGGAYRYRCLETPS